MVGGYWSKYDGEVILYSQPLGWDMLIYSNFVHHLEVKSHPYRKVAFVKFI